MVFILYNASVILIRDKPIKEAKDISEFVTPYIPSNDYSKRIRKLFLDGVISIYEGNITEGSKNEKDAIDGFKQLDETSAQD